MKNVTGNIFGCQRIGCQNLPQILVLSHNRNPPATPNTYYNLKVQFPRWEGVPPAGAVYPKSHRRQIQVGLVFITNVKGAVVRAHPRDTGQQLAGLLGLSSTNSLEKVMHKNPVASPLQMFYERKILGKIGK